jgi:leucyl aminopeptidase
VPEKVVLADTSTPCLVTPEPAASVDSATLTAVAVVTVTPEITAAVAILLTFYPMFNI